MYHYETEKIEHITLNLIVFGTIVIIGVLARQTVLHYGRDEFSSNLIFFGMLHCHRSYLSQFANSIQPTSFANNRTTPELNSFNACILISSNCGIINNKLIS